MRVFKPDREWTLFLDRDGVINQRIVDDYVKTWDEFHFIENTKKAIAVFAQIFGRIVVVTNQQGIGKGIMTEETLADIHEKMVNEIVQEGGRIDKVYHCPSLNSDGDHHRKPGPGMGLKAKKDFPEINFKKSLMIGDSVSDLKFGKSLSMFTTFISDDKAKISENAALIDFVASDLYSFAQKMNTNNI